MGSCERQAPQLLQPLKSALRRLQGRRALLGLGERGPAQRLHRPHPAQHLLRLRRPSQAIEEESAKDGGDRRAAEGEEAAAGGEDDDGDAGTGGGGEPRGHAKEFLAKLVEDHVAKRTVLDLLDGDLLFPLAGALLLRLLLRRRYLRTLHRHGYERAKERRERVLVSCYGSCGQREVEEVGMGNDFRSITIKKNIVDGLIWAVVWITISWRNHANVENRTVPMELHSRPNYKDYLYITCAHAVVLNEIISS